jgi:Kef-type K+ transport system membrane component KefB
MKPQGHTRRRRDAERAGDLVARASRVADDRRSFAFVVIRLVATLGSARLATRLSGMSGALGRDWGMALIGQGSLAAAIALNYRIFDDSDLSNVVFTVALVSVLATDLLSARVVRAVVRRHHRRVPVPAGLGER